MRRLAAKHALVLHPQACEAWVIRPFSVSPAHMWVQRGERGWWASCLWCALGISTLVGSEAEIHTRIGGEAEPVGIQVRDGLVCGPKLWAHFPELPRFAWNNVHHFCARLLPFRSPEAVPGWTERHGLALGMVLPLEQLSEFARRWYGRHAQKDWEKWTVAEASGIFREVGLTDAFWQLEPRDGTD